MARSYPIEGQICRRCGAQAVIQGRNEPLCQACFISYVQTKVIKRMEQFRVKNAEPGKPRTLLIPLSFGVSSLSLLYMLDAHLNTQLARTGRTGFDLHVLHVHLPEHDGTAETSLLAAVKQRFPRHTYSFVTILEGRLSSDNARSSSPTGTGAQTTLSHDASSSGESYAQLLASIPSITSRTDVLNIIRTRAIVDHAQRYTCEAILWGDSTTKLAEVVLAETAKGRGFSLPWQIADGESPWGISFYYPVRDLLKKELIKLSTYIEPPLSLLVREEGKEGISPAASKNGSIDLLMKQYFESVEDQYPSIVANVVRTTGKLERRTMADSKRCRLCKMLYTDRSIAEARSEDNWIGVGRSEGHDGSRLCHGCDSALPQGSLQFLPD